MNTLRGVFPEPPPVSRRNFIKENMIHIKRMQGFTVNDAGDHISFKKQSKQLENDATQRTMKLIRNTKRQIQNLSQMSTSEKPKQLQAQSAMMSNKRLSPEGFPNKTAVESLRDIERDRRKFKEIGVQTDHYNSRFHDGGNVKYITPRSPDIKFIKSPKGSNMGDGDRSKRRPESPMTVDDREKKDFVKENSSILHSKSSRMYTSNDPTKPPPTYQKGVVPKYLRERKEELIKHHIIGGDERCPEGHVVLPENERKETLRMLRQSYSELVCELNQLPVRSDTLKIRNRKIEIENQLKKLDEGIKVFTRPKVYVKIGV